MTGQVVVNTEPCDMEAPSCIPSYLARYGRCYGCLGNGRRALLDTAVEVEVQAWLLDADRTVIRWGRKR